VLLALAFVWFVRDAPRAGSGARPIEAASEHVLAPEVPDSLASSTDLATAETPVREIVADVERPAREPLQRSANGCDFVGTFCLPDGKEIPLDDAWVTLRGEGGSKTVVHARNSRRISARDLAPDVYSIEVRSSEFAHRPQRFELAERCRLRSEKLVMWSDDWVAIAIHRTTDGARSTSRLRARHIALRSPDERGARTRPTRSAREHRRTRRAWPGGLPSPSRRNPARAGRDRLDRAQYAAGSVGRSRALADGLGVEATRAPSA
jgi:hypothetical protein